MKSKISNRNLFKGGNIEDIFTSLNINSQDITNSYISSIDLKSDGFMFNQSYINTYYLHLAIFCYYYEKSKANRAEYITAIVAKIREYVKYFVLYQILNKIMSDNDDKDDKYLNAIKSMDDFDATPITFDENEKDFVKIKKILNATAFIIKYVKGIKSQLKDYDYNREKIKTLNNFIKQANENKGKTGISKSLPPGQKQELDNILNGLNSFDLNDISTFKISEVIDKAIQVITSIDNEPNKAELIVQRINESLFDELKQSYNSLLDKDKDELKEIGDIFNGSITEENAQLFYDRFNNEYIKREILLKLNYDALGIAPHTGGDVGDIDGDYLGIIVKSKFQTIVDSTADIYNLPDLQTPFFELYKSKAEAGLDIIQKKIDINNYPDKNDFIYNMYLFYNSYIKICIILEKKNATDVDELKKTALESLNFIENILTHIGDNKKQDISIIMNNYIDNFKTKISQTTTDDFLKRINDNTISQQEFNEEKALLLSKKIKPSSDDKLKIYEFLFKLNKNDSSITVGDIDNIQNYEDFKLSAYKYLLMKLLIDKDEDITSFINEKDVIKIKDKINELSSIQTGGTVNTNNIFNAYMIMVMNKIMEMNNDGLDNFNKNLKSIEG